MCDFLLCFSERGAPHTQRPNRTRSHTHNPHRPLQCSPVIKQQNGRCVQLERSCEGPRLGALFTQTRSILGLLPAQRNACTTRAVLPSRAAHTCTQRERPPGCTLGAACVCAALPPSALPHPSPHPAVTSKKRKFVADGVLFAEVSCCTQRAGRAGRCPHPPPPPRPPPTPVSHPPHPHPHPCR